MKCKLCELLLVLFEVVVKVLCSVVDVMGDGEGEVEQDHVGVLDGGCRFNVGFDPREDDANNLR